MTRRVKIVGTLGPASNTVEMISKLIEAGLNVARVNMSHGTYEGHGQVIRNIREASKKQGREVAVLLDLQGPKIRVDKLPANLKLQKDEVWVIGPTKVMDKYPEYKDHFIPTIYENLVKDAREGCTILFDDGYLEAKAIEKDRDVLKIKIVIGGELKSNKGINLPDVRVSAPSFTEKDSADLAYGLEQDIDYVALSFVRTAEDVQTVKKFMQEKGKVKPIIAKIEKPEAITNIESILEEVDGIMIARGDMGVEVGNHLVPPVQKHLIALCNEVGKPVITATQMLESMISNPRPTRAEASDVANAVWDGTDAVMLSAESASGQYPVEAVTMMTKIIMEAEKTPKEFCFYGDNLPVSASVQYAAALLSESTEAKTIVSVSESGDACRQMSHFRPNAALVGVTNSVSVARKMALYWGVQSYVFDAKNADANTAEAKLLKELQEKGIVAKEDKVVITRQGDGALFHHEGADTIRVIEIK